MKIRAMLAATAAVALALPLTIAADDEAVGTAAFESLSVEVVDGEIAVEGVATFGGETIVVAEDAVGDATIPSAGVDLTTLTITQADDNMTFEMGLADAVPQAGSFPTGVVYRWPLVANGNSLELAAWPTNVVSTAFDGAGPYWVFTLYTLTPDGFTEAPVDGEFTGSSLVWRVPLGATGLQPGQNYRPFEAPRAATGFSGLLTVGGNDYDTVLSDRFIVGGGATVTVLDGTGEEVDEVRARLRRGMFAATVEGLDPGTYTVVVTTGYGDAEVSETFTVTI